MIAYLKFQPYSRYTEQNVNSNQTPDFFDTFRFPMDQYATVVDYIRHDIRLDRNQKPKNFYTFQVYFKKEGSEQETSETIMLEKVYGDFKKLHQQLTETFENEVKEYDKIDHVIKGGHASEGNFIQIGPLEKGSYDSNSSANANIMLTQRALDEYYIFGKTYKEEAQRILAQLPVLPSKFDESSSEGGVDGPRVSAN